MSARKIGSLGTICQNMITRHEAVANSGAVIASCVLAVKNENLDSSHPKLNGCIKSLKFLLYPHDARAPAGMLPGIDVPKRVIRILKVFWQNFDGFYINCSIKFTGQIFKSMYKFVNFDDITSYFEMFRGAMASAAITATGAQVMIFSYLKKNYQNHI